MITRFFAYFRRSQDIGSEEYERLHLLERTRMSEVWLARRKRDKRITVTKIARIKPSRYERANQEAIQNEASWLRKFKDQPRIVQIYHTAVTNLEGRPRFIAAEYLDGGTLDDLLTQSTSWGRFLELLPFFSQEDPQQHNSQRDSQDDNHHPLPAPPVRRARFRRGRLPVEQALQILGMIAEGLAILHSQGVVHRDIKPDNIMFRRRPAHGRLMARDDLVIIDLGIAAAKSKPASAAVSRGWSDPICVQAIRSRRKLISETEFDIYSLGRVLEYMLTGEKPSPNEPGFERNPSITPDELRFIRRVSRAERTDIASELSSLIQRCLTETMSSRPTAPEMLQASHLLLNRLTPSRSFLPVPIVVSTTVILLVLLFSLAFAQGSGRLTLPPPISTALVPFNAALVEASEQVQPWLARAETALDRLVRSEPNNDALDNDSSDGVSLGNTTGQPSIQPKEDKGTAADKQDSAAVDVETSIHSSEVNAVGAPTLVQPPPLNSLTVGESTASPSIPETDDGQAVASNVESNTESNTESNAELAALTIENTPQSPTSTALPSTLPPTPTTTLESTVATAMATAAQTATRRPYVTRRPTSTPTAAQAIGATAASATVDNAANERNYAINILQVGRSHPCDTAQPTIWENEVELIWENHSTSSRLPSQYTFEVVVWIDERNEWIEARRPPTDAEAFTIHGPDDLTKESEIRYRLFRRPRAILSVFADLAGQNTPSSGQVYRWGIALVQKPSTRIRLLTPPSGCQFILHPAVLNR
ncbi:MAG: protein kinase [Chloroflexota bacterium]